MDIKPLNVEQTTAEALELLSDLNLRDQIEVMANVLISTGMARMSLPDGSITPENVVDIVMKDKSKNGETLHNALAHQGLVMLMWLRK